MQRRHRLNYFYFGTLFVLLALLHIFHVTLIEKGTILNRLFYITYSIGECLFEIGALILLGAWVSEKLPAFAKVLFIVGTFLLFLIHLIDFPLIRIMDISIWYGFSIIFAESFDNFIEMLKASHIELTTWLLLWGGICLTAFMGLFLFFLTDKFSARKPFYFSYSSAFLFTFSVMGGLSFFDYQVSTLAAAPADGHFLKTLPWKTTLLPSSYPKCTLPKPLIRKPPEEWYQKNLQNFTTPALKKPNIYLFVAESIREDFITPEVAPTLSQFKKDHISFPCTASAANATHLSWFSIFHSVYPFSWGDRQPQKWSLGSLPLHLLKKAGYQIHVLSASRLVFYKMDQILFGKGRALVDDFQVFSEQNVDESHIYDAKCMDTLLKKMEKALEGHLFIIFFEGTHFDYSWPSDLVLPSRPFTKAIDYIKITYSKEGLEGIKNRYRHAIHHIDYQFHRFLNTLRSHPKQKEAVVVFTSDHGEEFFEEGRIFHASNLNRAQTSVPLYYRLPSKPFSSPVTSHLDIFPTLIDHVFGEIPSQWFDGESILRPRKKPFAISTRFNASRTPYEFLITTDKETIISRFDKRNDIYESKALEIVSRKDAFDRPLETSSFQDNFRALLESFILNH